VEHQHHCLYCAARWFCHDDSCVLHGPSACDGCREKIRRAPDMTLRVIELERGDRVLDRLAQQEAERLRRRLRRGWRA
jgi:hypothetical protein